STSETLTRSSGAWRPTWRRRGKAILFGSAARGDADEWSDLDMVIVTDTSSLTHPVLSWNAISISSPSTTSGPARPLDLYPRGVRANAGRTTPVHRARARRRATCA